MDEFKVGAIAYEDGLRLNEGLNDDQKVAFQNADGTEFYIKDPETYPTDLPSSKYEIKTISQSVVDGTLPIPKPRRLYP